ncbi:hypothetical protein Tco_1353264 [Tanacetum coccineum]
MAKPTEKHLHAVKQMFRCLKGTGNMGLWYSKDTGIALIAYADVDHARCQDSRRSTSGSAQFLGGRASENGRGLSLYLIRQNIKLGKTSSPKHWQERFEFLISRIKMKSMSQETLKSLAEEEEE